jgi:hypothetical protein
MENRRDDETETAVLEAVRAANTNESFPTVDDLNAILSGRGLTANEIAAAADRLYRSNRVSVNSDGGIHARD